MLINILFYTYLVSAIYSFIDINSFAYSSAKKVTKLSKQQWMVLFIKYNKKPQIFLNIFCPILNTCYMIQHIRGVI